MLPIYKYREDKGSDNALELLKCGYPIREFRFGAECFVHQSPSVGKKAERGLSGTFILVLNHAVAGGLHKGSAMLATITGLGRTASTMQ